MFDRVSGCGATVSAGRGGGPGAWEWYGELQGDTVQLLDIVVEDLVMVGIMRAWGGMSMPMLARARV